MNLREEIELYVKTNPKYSKELIDKFIAYWEKEVKGKPKYLNEKIFKIGQRLATFKRNEEKYKTKNMIVKLKSMANQINLFK